MGVTLDPSYAFPLPIFGINYLDFEFGSPDTQLALLFAGVLAAGNIQRPKLGIDAARRQRRLLRDRGAVERSALRRRRRARGRARADLAAVDRRSTSAGSPRRSRRLTLQYQFRFDGYVARSHDVARTSRVPSSTVTNGLGGAWEYRRGGYSLVLQRRLVRRASAGSAWGSARTARRRRSRPTRSTRASLSRDFYFNAVPEDPSERRLVRRPATSIGSPSISSGCSTTPGSTACRRPGVRFGELAMARGSYSFNIFEQYRLDLFLEQAWGRDRAFDDELAADHRHRRRGQPPGAVGIRSCARTSARACCRTATATSDRRRSRLCAEAASMTRPDLLPRRPPRPLRCHSTAERQPAVPRQPRLLLAARGRLPRRQGARHGPRRHHRSRLIDGASSCSIAHPGRDDIIVGEEVSCRLPGRRHRGAPRRLRDDRGAAPRHPAAAAQRLRRDGAPARGAASSSRSIICCISIEARCRSTTTCGCSTRCRRSRSATARCWRRTTC